MSALERNAPKKDSSNDEESEPFQPLQKSTKLQLTYFIDDNPPWYMSLFLGFQHYLTMFGGTVAISLLIAKFLCAGNNGLVKSNLICTIFFVSGISTLLQSSIGVRLPIIQGGSFSFFAPTIAILTLPKWKCPDMQQELINSSTLFNSSTVSHDEDIWKPRIREIQGAIMVASLLQVVIGVTGSMGLLLKYVGPLTITPAIALIGLSLFDIAAASASKHWGTAILTIVLVVLFSQYLRNVRIPMPAYNRTKGVHKKCVKLFELFPVLFAVALCWLLCVILTVTNHYEPGHPARTDIRLSVLHEAPWFRVPYPGQWGTPTVSIAGVIGMLAGVMAGIIESVGDYYACARLSGAPPVPNHAVNRGILMEGLCCLLAGAFGSGTGTTSYSENIGAIGITKVGSRRVIQYGGLFMLVLAVFGKFGALFATIPEPIIGGVFIVMFSMVTAVGISSLQFVDLNSVRNLFIIGFSLFLGLVIPKWIHANKSAIDTGSHELDQVLFVLLNTSMWVGGMIGFVLDVTLPGTEEERGIINWRKSSANDEDVAIEVASIHTYDLPFVTPFLQKCSSVRYVPFLPYYGEELDEEESIGSRNDHDGNNGIEDPNRRAGDDIETTI